MKVEKKAEDAVKKATAQKEAAPGGIIDVITDVLADHAKTQKHRAERRSEIETEVATK